jgi:hypothetical protein
MTHKRLFAIRPTTDRFSDVKNRKRKKLLKTTLDWSGSARYYSLSLLFFIFYSKKRKKESERRKIEGSTPIYAGYSSCFLQNVNTDCSSSPKQSYSHRSDTPVLCLSFCLDAVYAVSMGVGFLPHQRNPRQRQKVRQSWHVQHLPIKVGLTTLTADSLHLATFRRHLATT